MDRHHPGMPRGDTEAAMLWDQIPFPRCRPGGGPGGCRNRSGALLSRRERRGEALAASAAAGALGEASPSGTPRHRVLEGDALPGTRTRWLDVAHPGHPEKERGGPWPSLGFSTGSARGMWPEGCSMPLPEHPKC